MSTDIDSESKRKFRRCIFNNSRNQICTIDDIAITVDDVIKDGIQDKTFIDISLNMACLCAGLGIVKNERKELLGFIHKFIDMVRFSLDIPIEEKEPICMFSPIYCNDAYSYRCYECDESIYAYTKQWWEAIKGRSL